MGFGRRRRRRRLRLKSQKELAPQTDRQAYRQTASHEA
jgi:hypothetical protein